MFEFELIGTNYVRNQTQRCPIIIKKRVTIFEIDNSKKGPARGKKGKSMPFQAKSKAIVHCTLGYKYSNFFTEWTFCKGMAWFFFAMYPVCLFFLA